MQWNMVKNFSDPLITKTCRTELLKLLTTFNQIYLMDLAIKTRSIYIAHQVRTSSTHQLG